MTDDKNPQATGQQANEDDLASGKAPEPAPTGPTEDRSESMLAAEGTYDALPEPTRPDTLQPTEIPAAASEQAVGGLQRDEAAGTPDPDAAGDIASGDGHPQEASGTDEKADGMLNGGSGAGGGGSASW